MLNLEPITRHFLMKVAFATPMATPELRAYSRELQAAGAGGVATEDEIQIFDKLLDDSLAG